jgi:nucleotide-binding universal stress UspA family protein
MTAPDVVAIRNILVATDFSRCSDQAVQAALALARRLGAQLHLLHVVPRAPEREAALDRLATFAEAHIEGVPFTAAVAAGRPAPEIVSHAEREHMDLVVVGTHGRTGLAHVVMGSVAEAVVRTAPCQVLTIRLREQSGETAAQPVRAAAGAAVQGHCLVCARASDNRICDACTARIRGEALERMLRDEKAGRPGSAV